MLLTAVRDEAIFYNGCRKLSLKTVKNYGKQIDFFLRYWASEKGVVHFEDVDTRQIKEFLLTMSEAGRKAKEPLNKSNAQEATCKEERIYRGRGIRPFIGEDGLESLKGFDPKIQYAMTDKTGPVFKSTHQHQIEVGKNSNLISDMCWYGATSEELVRVIKHGMVLLDAQKHFLNWKQSAKDYGVEELRKRYRRYYRRPQFTEHERLVIAAYTGYVINGDDADKITPFVEETLGHKIRTPEPPQMPIIVEIHKALKEEFCDICRRHHIFNI